ncbi:MAG: aminoacyl--tRNA ligase-related protein [Acidilobaceae archaeon]
MSGTVKDHIDYAYELDLAIKPESSVPIINREYGVFSGPGVPLFSIGGGYFRHALQQILVNFHSRRGYLVVETPLIASSELFKLSGHMDFYKSNMFILNIEDREFVLKPMNCPYHLLIFLNHIARFRSKVKLPFKIFEIGRVHRFEPSGSLYGLLRVRGFTQDDAHIITFESDTLNVILNVFDEIKLLLESVFNLPISQDNIRIRLSLSDKNLIGKDFMGTIEEWSSAEDTLEKITSIIAEKYGIKASIGVGEAAFYGPKIDIIMTLKSSSGVKEWQMGTIQFDFNLPRRFKIYDIIREVYGDNRVYIIHRALIGSIERFLGGYLEHYRGRLPLTLAPIQVAIIAIKTGDWEVDEVILDKTINIREKLLSNGLRVGLKESTKTSLPGDIRSIESTIKPPIIIYIGAREVRESILTISIFSHKEMKRISKTIKYSSLDEALTELENIIRGEEEGVIKISGFAPRIPADLSHML